ncbi:unnamed protein product [Penicillium glandicola]
MQATNPTEESNAYDGVPDEQAPKMGDLDPIFGAFGVAEERPGFWAKRAIRCEWKRGFTASLSRGSLIYRLTRMPLQREPILQLNSKNLKRSHPNGSQWDCQIGAHKTDIEALVGQAVGELLDENSCCLNCAKLDGKFANCVRVPRMTARTNCHFERQGVRCSFVKEENEANAPTPNETLM